MHNIAKTNDKLNAFLASCGLTFDDVRIIGQYRATFASEAGEIYHEELFDNLITLGGKALMLDGILGPTSTYTLVGPYMGLISSTSFSGVAVGDTMASHAGWLEAGTTNAPTYSGGRLTVTFAASSPSSPSVSKATTTPALTYTFTGSGTVEGAFIVTATGAVSTVGSTAGTLFSAGTLATPQPVVNGNTLTLTYSATLN